MGRFSTAPSQTAFSLERGSPLTSRVKRMSPCARLRRTMRAWLESARAGETPAKIKASNIRETERNNVREFMVTPWGDALQHPLQQIGRQWDGTGCTPYGR